MKAERFRLLIDFKSKEALQEWVQNAKELQLVPEESRARPVDGLDHLGGGIEQYILRKEGH